MQLYRHVKTDRVYVILHSAAILESDGSGLVVYQGIDESTVWVRSSPEFHDGRFVKLKPSDTGRFLAKVEELSEMVGDMAESLAEAGVTPCAGSMNPHEDTLGRALELVPSARHAVERIAAQQDTAE